VFLGRWIALIRIATAWLAGINEMHFPQFFVWNACGGILWAVTYGLVGYFGGHAAAHVLSQIGIVGAVILALFVLAFLLYLRFHREPGLRNGETSDVQEPADDHAAED
jgi:membrane protein DedA with SNARE-associated domain